MSSQPIFGKTEQPKRRAVRETAAKLIYRALQADIIAMKLLPGTALNEKNLYRSFRGQPHAGS